jgi:hypothetical protein
VTSTHRLLLTAAVAAAFVLSLLALSAEPQPAAAAAARSCAKVADPFAGTRYEGSDLTRIRATGVACSTARRIARGAQRKALGITPTSPIKRFSYDGWSVRGDLRGEHDAYTATKGARRITWRF